MTITRRDLLRTAAAASAVPAGLRAQSRQSADVAIYGATPGGIAAAVSAARMGQSVLLCEYEDHIGGIVSNGLTNADIGKRQAVGGMFYEFTRRVVRHYEEMDRNDPAQPNVKLCRNGYYYEAGAAEQIFHEMILEQQGRIRLLLSHELRSAAVRRDRLSAMVLSSRAAVDRTVTIEAQVFIDATYEGDLAAMAKAPFRTGREGRTEYNEPHAGKIYMRVHDNHILPGSTGEADEATQAYCFRFHVTNLPEKRVPIEKPAAYNRDDYRFLLDDIRAARVTKFREAIQVYPMPNGRFELNSNHVDPVKGIPSESLDLAEACWPWPTATPTARRRIYDQYRTHNVGMIWLLQNDSDVPESLRQEARQWGWHRDEWVANGHVPRQVYVRQGRRIVGDYILTEHDADLDAELQRTRVQKTSIAVLEWAFDPHGHHRYDPAHPFVREGYYILAHEPFQVPYGVLVPRRVEGLLVPVACSCSHVAYNALRMEPVFMALGEVCGIAAHLAIAQKVAVRKIPTPELQKLLVECKGVITFYDDLPFDDADFSALQWLGARGLSGGYKAEKNTLLSRMDGAERLARILRHEGKAWNVPAMPDGGAALSAVMLDGWLREAGYTRGSAADAAGQLSLRQFAGMVYSRMTAAA